MIIRNISFDFDLSIEEDHVSSILAEPPELFARIVQSFSAMEAGETTPETFLILDGEKQIDPQKQLIVIADPFHVDVNSRKNLSLLYGELTRRMMSEPAKLNAWEKLMIQAEEIVEQITGDLTADIYPGNILPFSSFLKETGVRFEFAEKSDFKDRISDMMHLIAEFMPQKLLVLCNIAAYCNENDWYEMMKTACYLKVKVLNIETKLPEKPYEHEIRWIIHSDFNDEIVKG